MIAAPAPSLPPAEAARRAGQGRLPVWLVSPGDADVGIEREVVACDPVRLVRGSSVEALEAAWREERALWRGGPGIPIAVGTLSYDLGRRFERPAGEPAVSVWPDIEFRFYDAIWTARGGSAEILARDLPAAHRLAARLATSAPAARTALGPLRALDPPERHLAAIERALVYLRAGDAYQVNLARRLVATVGDDGPPGLGLFTRLLSDAPAPHAVWLADAERGSCVVGNSPERFLRLDADGRIETRPIKGTRPRASGRDDHLAEALACDPKDRAEHVMIVDLERNDLGRVCEVGSVTVSGLARVVSLPTVHHLVTTISGRLRTNVGLTDLLRATFPGGSITGTPKIRAMEIIDELEPAPRGLYTGATGWLGAAGDLDLAVAIRTAVIRDGMLTLWVGGGIVIDSTPEAELRETEAKARAFASLAAQP